MLKLMAHEAQDFLNPFYFKKIICEEEFYRFTNALKNYRTNLQSNANQNEDSLVANALKPFFEALWFQAEAKHKQKGNSEIDLALKKDSAVSVIIEAKKPESKEIPSAENPNAKALHEAILYYFREREMGNLGIKSIVLTDFYRFFIIKSRAFESVFYENPAFKKLYANFTAPNSLFKGNTDEFYNESKRILDLSEIELNYFCIDLARIFNENDFSFPSIKPIFKVLNREFLLDEFSPNDANVLNERFYRELLYIMGLDEFKEGKNILIKPSKESKIEQNTLYKCILDKLPSENRNFDFAMQFVILWLNRILFLKLVEANLVRFNADKNLKFLHLSKVIDFKTLSNLFFEILAKMPDERKDSPLSFLPYLNSSLFERHKCEETLDISALDDNAKLAYFNETQLKDKFAKKKQGDVGLLAYIFEFLDAFDFGSDEGSGELATQKELISSSVLGLVFEKLNGYKEGSFFTPSFITGYMCKESLEKVVVQKFGDLGLNAPNLAVLKSQILININADFGFRDKALKILKSIKICDPAVGSGHFLVSALCEMVRIYRELGLVEDTLNACEIAVHNDEVHISKDSKVFTYQKPRANNENHKIQKSLFNLKKSIIENNLFGVDINPNSVEICKLRLWIELLKNSYYLVDLDDGFNANLSDKIHQMQTLPNIDINIKCGNSLISYFDLRHSLAEYPNIAVKIKEYKNAVADYKEGFFTSKRQIDKTINELNESFRNFLFHSKFAKEISAFRKKCSEYSAKYGDYLARDDKNLSPFIAQSFGIFDFDKESAKCDFEKLKRCYDSIFNLQSHKSFEWRFEFPEVLDENGDFMGFDLVIGNPPYIKEADNKRLFEKTKDLRTYQGKMDIWYHFVGKGLDLVKNKHIVTFIATNNWTTNTGAQNLRNVILRESQILNLVDFGAYMCFDSASIQTMIMEFQKCDSIPKSYAITYAKIETKKPTDSHRDAVLARQIFEDNIYLTPIITPKNLIDKTLNFVDTDKDLVLNKILKNGKFRFDDLEIQIGIGLTDKVKRRMDLANHKIGEGIFQLSTQELKNLNLSTKEKKLIKPLYTTKELCKFYGNPKNNEWVIYTDSSFKNPKSMDKYPNLKRHLDKFKSVITSDNKPYGLHRAKQERFFNQTPSIVSLRKCPNEPIFTYVDFDCYVTSTFFIIQTNRIDMKYLTGILNSKLIAFWLRYKGKLQGTHYQIDKEPLLKIPIVKPNAKNRKIADEIVNLVDKILESKSQGKETSALESQVDDLVYELYDLSKIEKALVES